MTHPPTLPAPTLLVPTLLAPTLLAMDAAGASCSVALWTGGRVVARRFAAMARGQSEQLVPMIAEVMAAWGGGFAALDALAVTTGPGGFTGVRDRKSTRLNSSH